jgi:hypothetical protein
VKKYLLAAAAAALFAASPAAAAGFNGVVVGKSGGALAVATPTGVVHKLHGNARVGAVIRVSGTRFAVVGTARRATFRGVVVRRLGSMQFLAAGGMMLAVRSHSRTVATAGDNGPSPGTVVQDTVNVSSNGVLTQQSSQTVGQTGNVSVQATVTSVGAGTVTITVNGQALTLPLPAGLTLPSTIVGSQVTLSLNLGGGTTTATAEDEDSQGDDNDDQDDDSDGGEGGGD